MAARSLFQRAGIVDEQSGAFSSSGSSLARVVDQLWLFVGSRGSMKAKCAAPDTALAARDGCDVSRDEGRARRRFVRGVGIMQPWRAASADQELRSA
jgi:hypothetical protein